MQQHALAAGVLPATAAALLPGRRGWHSAVLPVWTAGRPTQTDGRAIYRLIGKLRHTMIQWYTWDAVVVSVTAFVRTDQILWGMKDVFTDAATSCKVNIVYTSYRYLPNQWLFHQI